MSDEVRDAIEDNAKGPKRVRGDEGEVEQHSIRDQIEASRYLAGNQASKQPHRGIRLTKVITARGEA